MSIGGSGASGASYTFNLKGLIDSSFTKTTESVKSLKESLGGIFDKTKKVNSD